MKSATLKGASSRSVFFFIKKEYEGKLGGEKQHRQSNKTVCQLKQAQKCQRAEREQGEMEGDTLFASLGLFPLHVYAVGMGSLTDSESLISAVCKTLMNNTGIYQLIVCFSPLPFGLHTLLSLSPLHSFLPAVMRNTC